MICLMCVMLMSSLLIFPESITEVTDTSCNFSKCQCGTEQPLGLGLGKKGWGDRASHLSHESDVKLFAEETVLHAS